LVQRYPESSSKVKVIPLGVSPALAPASAERDGLPEEGFVLAVGTLEPRKNLPRLVSAYKMLPAQVKDAHPLVVVGARGWRMGDTLAALRSLGPRVVMLGEVSDADLAELYRRCAVFCYPSLGEGFGLPVLEAMAAGAPVVTSNVSSLPEVGGEAVEYVDPLSETSIVEGLLRVVTSERRRNELRGLGPDRARAFSWAKTSAMALQLLEEAAG
jgi:alpha-1,3-rhamnosyl/mannosyltransferase